MKTTANYYPGFAYPASELFQYIAVQDLFSIILNHGDIVKFTPDNTDDFKDWLLAHHVKDIRSKDGWIIKNDGI